MGAPISSREVKKRNFFLIVFSQKKDNFSPVWLELHSLSILGFGVKIIVHCPPDSLNTYLMAGWQNLTAFRRWQKWP